jgi:long-subunit fatty acid transport protein
VIAAQSNPLVYSSAFTRTGIQYWSSGGAAIAEEGLATAALTNPATLAGDEVSLYAEVGKRAETNWPYDFRYDGQWITPAYVALLIPENGWYLSAGYANYYSDDIFTEPIPVTTETMPEGTGEFFQAERTTLVHDFFGSIRYRPSELLSLGLTLGLNDVTINDKLFDVEADASGYGVLVVAGALYQPLPVVNIGATFTLSSTVNIDASYFGNGQLVRPTNSGDSLIPPLGTAESYRFTAEFPWIAAAGVDWKYSSTIDFMLGLEYRHWSGISGSNRNPLQIHCGTALTVSPAFVVRFGFFTAIEPISMNQHYLNQNFLSAGIEYLCFDHIKIVAGIIDSHFLSNSDVLPSFENLSNQFRQTYVSLGVSYSR